MDKKIILEVKKLREDGLSYGDIAKRLLITKSQANYFSKIDLDKVEKKKQSKEKYEKDVCDVAARCRNFNQLCNIFSKKATNETVRYLKEILDRRGVDYSHFISAPEVYRWNAKRKLEDILLSGNTVSVTHLRDRLINEGVKERKCEKCGRSEWEGEPIPLQLHHINGDRTDNRLENLQLLCPNCHALTDNYCRRKTKIVKDEKFCPICGRKMKKDSQICKVCYGKLFNIKKLDLVYDKDGNLNLDDEKIEFINKLGAKESKCPSKEELLESFKESGSFSSVGKKYGVSDKTISNWCFKFGLPMHSTEMRNYIRNLFGDDIKWKFTNGNSQSFIEYNNSRFRKIALLNDDGEIDKIYNSYKEISDDGFIPSRVGKICKGERKTYKGKKFKYLDVS